MRKIVVALALASLAVGCSANADGGESPTTSGDNFALPQGHAMGDRVASADNVALYPNTTLVSASGRFSARFRAEGDLVVEDGATVIWSNGTSGLDSKVLRVQSDGNLVLYGNRPQPNDIFASAVGGANWVPLWATHTNDGDSATLVMQDDGNLVLYGSQWNPTWATNTNIAP